MLVLTREKGETVFIGEKGEIQVLVVEIRGDKVRLGFTAPRDTPVHRQEVFEAIQRQNEEKE